MAKKFFNTYREQLLHLAKLYNVIEIKSYARSAKRLTVAQLELILINSITFLLLSTNVISDAPLLTASNPSIPLPAKISNTDKSFRFPNISNILFLTLDEVGRYGSLLLVFICKPL